MFFFTTLTCIVYENVRLTSNNEQNVTYIYCRNVIPKSIL